MRRWTSKLAFTALTLAVFSLSAAAAHAAEPRTLLLTADRVWTGDGQPHANWAVLVSDGRIREVGPLEKISVPVDAERVALPGKTLIPGLIDLHSHVLLHPYHETSWDDQALKAQVEYRTLLALLERPGHVVTRDYLHEMVYGSASAIESNTIAVFIHQLRRKLGDNIITTVHGQGYMIEGDA